jgi:undecaprenyl-diphosphatase
MKILEKREGLVLLILTILGITSFFFDNKIALFFKSHQNTLLSKFFLIFDPTWIMLLLYGFIILLVWTKAKHKWTLPFILTLGISLGLSLIFKLVFSRERPFGLIETFPIVHLIDYSFPSNHSTAIFSAMPILNKEFRKLNMLWIIVALTIAFSRIYLGVHYLSDVIFGGLLGYFTGIVILRISEKMIR